jgi:hypothetical protein
LESTEDNTTQLSTTLGNNVIHFGITYQRLVRKIYLTCHLLRSRTIQPSSETEDSATDWPMDQPEELERLSEPILNVGHCEIESEKGDKIKQILEQEQNKDNDTVRDLLRQHLCKCSNYAKVEVSGVFRTVSPHYRC